jgi:SAM-dependent methyltransferase
MPATATTVTSHVIEHPADSGAVVRDIGRVLKPGDLTGGLMPVATPTQPPLFAS